MKTFIVMLVISAKFGQHGFDNAKGLTTVYAEPEMRLYRAPSLEDAVKQALADHQMHRVVYAAEAAPAPEAGASAYDLVEEASERLLQRLDGALPYLVRYSKADMPREAYDLQFASSALAALQQFDIEGAEVFEVYAPRF